jgi:hypothetical protein
LLDANFVKLTEATIYLKRDAAWGKRLKNIVAEPHLPALDDARLFLYDSQIYVSYREGKGFGYGTQVLNPIHLTFDDGQFSATIVASQSSSICCGRNMALMQDFTANQLHQDLYSLTWVDPVTVEKIDMTPVNQRPPQMENKKPAKHKSHIHGTNAFMVPLPGKNPVEFLGVAHFHRPSGRGANPYARFGHHYTHAFYSVAPEESQNVSSFQLTGLSQEFVLPSFHDSDDAEIIQFVSGLEYNPATKQVILAYGINDCEGAITTMDLQIVRSMLTPVGSGKQVVDYMLPLVSVPSHRL